MDVTNQIYLNIIILTFGLIFTYPVYSMLNPALSISFAWFVGWSLVIISELILIISGFYVTLPRIFFFLVIYILAIWICAIYKLEKKYLLNPFRVSKQYWEFAVILLLSITVIMILSHFGNHLYFSGDSFQFEGLSRMFHKYGIYGTREHSNAFKWLVNIRLPFYVSIHNVAYIFGIEVFYSFMSITTYFVAIGLIGFWRKETDDRCLSIFCIIIAIILFLSNRIVIFHSFYSHSNLTTMAYYTFGILCISQYLKSCDGFWFLAACLFLGCTGLIRKEMQLFSLIPLFFISWNSFLPKMRLLIFGFATFFLFSYFWFSWESLNLLSIPEIVHYKTREHGGFLIVLICLVLSATIFFLPLKIVTKNFRRVIYILFFILAILLGYYLKDRMIVSFRDFYSLVFLDKGHWGGFWYFFLLGLLIYVLLCLGSFKDIYTDCLKNRNLNLLIFVILTFFVSRIVLFGIYQKPALGWNNGGNRILLHIYPVAVYFIARVMFICLDGIAKWKN